MPSNSQRHPRTYSADPRRLREEHDLFVRLAADPAARTAIVERFMPLARRLARRYEHGREDLDDLEQVAAIGLLKAIDRFDPERGVTFTTFAFPTILGELKRHFRDRGWAVRVPRPLQDRVARIEILTKELSGELGRSPTVTELATRSATTNEEVIEALQAAKARQATSFDRPWNESGETFDLAIVDPGFEQAENAADLEHLMGMLDERERLILRLRFREDRLQSQIAEMTGVSQMHISRLISRAIDRLHEASRQSAPAA
ncbi:MAG TPA: SigB/SigF/SigG family RNA polymerase sigma factor [Solirubrobacter sp.]